MSTYTRQGMTKAVSSELNAFENKIYTKKNLSSKQIDNFLRLYHLGIGITIIDYDKSKGEVKMQGGISLQRCIDGNMGLLTNIAVKQLPRIQAKLKENKIAHCDIKPSNFVLKNDGSGIFLLIDNDHIVNFGEIRQVGTPGLNCQKSNLLSGEKTNYYTDDMGFEKTLSMIRTSDPFQHVPSNDCTLF